MALVGSNPDRGMGQHLVLGHERGSRVLEEHEPAVEARLLDEEGRQAGHASVDEERGAALADRAELGAGDGGEVHGEGDGLPVEVAARDDVPAAGRERARVDVRPGGEDERVVGRRVDLHLDDAADVAEGIAGGPVDLGHAADRVGVLHLVRLAMVGALSSEPRSSARSSAATAD